jgi:hypothetical protein
MVPIELSEEMAEMMREVLVSHLSELRMEIAYTNRKEFREYLKRMAALLEEFLVRLDKKLAAGGLEAWEERASPVERKEPQEATGAGVIW